MKTISYRIPPLNQAEPDVRLADAMLFAALKSALGDRIAPTNSLHDRETGGPVWGPDPLHVERTGMLMRRAAYEDPNVLAALGGGRVVPAHRVQEEMDRLGRSGHGAAVRNMVDPVNRKRFLQPGSRFDANCSHLRISKGSSTPFLVHPDFEADYERRFLVVAGEIAGESPAASCSEDPARLLDPDNRTREARQPWETLEAADPARLALQRKAAEDLLAKFPMLSGAIDVGMATAPGDAGAAHVIEVIAARPGDVSIMFADPVAYAGTIARHLPLIEPSMNEESAPGLG